MAELVIEGLTRRFAEVLAVNQLSLQVSNGEFITLLGPSGCGKSTTLASIAGLDRPEEGLIRLGDKVFFDSTNDVYLPPEARSCGLVFQSYALWPHMTVKANVEFPLILRSVTSLEMKRRVYDCSGGTPTGNLRAPFLALCCGLSGYNKLYPCESDQ